MAGAVHKAFRVSFAEAWYQLSEEEHKALLAKVNAALETVGGKSVVFCDSGWSSEEWQFFGVEVFPSIEAAQKHAELLAAINWHRYIKSSTLLGTAATV